MLFKNVASQKIAVYAYNSVTGLPDTGDAANITGYYSLDGGTATIFSGSSGNPTELSGSHAPGVYIFSPAQGETNGNCIVITAASVTANVVIEPLIIYTPAGAIPSASTALSTLTQANVLNAITGGTVTLTVDANGRIGVGNLGGAIVNEKVGAVVEVELPRGVVKFQVLSIK